MENFNDISLLLKKEIDTIIIGLENKLPETRQNIIESLELYVGQTCSRYDINPADYLLYIKRQMEEHKKALDIADNTFYGS